MATVYDSMALKTVTNQSQTAVNAPIIVDAWLEEGAITVASTKTYSNGGALLDRPLYSWASQISYDDDPTAPDFVTLATSDSAYTYSGLQGKIILSAQGTNTNPIVGVIGSDPIGPVRIPVNSAAADTVAERVAGLYLRHTQVTLFGFAYYPVAVEATTDIAVGDHLLYDNSDALWKKDGAAASPVISCHVATDASGQYVGALFYGIPTTQA